LSDGPPEERTERTGNKISLKTSTTMTQTHTHSHMNHTDTMGGVSLALTADALRTGAAVKMLEQCVSQCV
jgi:hypothetical protein